MDDKNKYYNAFSWLVVVLVALLGVYFFIKSKAEAAEINYFSIPCEQEFLYEKLECRTVRKYDRGGRVVDQRAKWQEEYDFHMFHAKRTYEDAKNRTWRIPDLTLRERARHCFIAAFAAVGSSTPTGRLVMVVSSFFLQYGLDCMDEWDYINEKLTWSQYHFDECDKYAQLLYGK